MSYNRVKLGVIREGKTIPDRRSPLTPTQAKEIQKKYPHATIKVQKSAIRSFRDKEYEEAGIQTVSDVSDCDIFLGVKEVPIENLIPNKTYLFFSHTTKQQSYNKTLLQAILSKKIQLIDYENLTAPCGNRLLGFGRYAGIVGAYNGLITYGRRHHLYDLRRAYTCPNLKALHSQLQKIALPGVKIALTGNGRVAHGAMEILNGIPGIQKVSPKEFLNRTFATPVYTQLKERDYLAHKERRRFNKEEFYTSPQNYISDFQPFTRETDLLIAGAYWNPKSPVLFTKQDTQALDFNITVIADITCDIEGSIPSTKRSCSIENPFYDYDPMADAVKAPFSSSSHITVMAIDNLPCELPRLASEDFGKGLVDKVMPALLTTDTDHIIKHATITRGGKLTQRFAYLEHFVRENSLEN